MESKQEKIKNLVKDMLIESHQAALKSIDKAILSGVLDVEGWDGDYQPMIIPKTIVTAILESEARQYTARGTTHQKRMGKEVRALKCFI